MRFALRAGRGGTALAEAHEPPAPRHEPPAPRIRGELRLRITDPVTGVAASFAFPAEPTTYLERARAGGRTELRRTDGRCLHGHGDGAAQDAGVLEERVTWSGDGSVERYSATWSVPDPRRPDRRRCVCEVSVEELPGG